MEVLEYDLTKKEVQRNIISIYNAFSSGGDIIKSFNRIFNIEYPLIFGKDDPFKALFKLLSEYYQNEYYIKHSFIIKNLYNSKSIYFDEYPIGDVRADIISINGHITVYEIKTEYDNTKRLANQLENYLQYFEYVYIICDEKKVSKIIDMIPDDCGIYTYKKRINGRFTKIKNASRSRYLNKKAILTKISKKYKLKYFLEENNDVIVKNTDLDTIYKVYKAYLKDTYYNKYSEMKDECLKLIDD